MVNRHLQKPLLVMIEIVPMVESRGLSPEVIELCRYVINFEYMQRHLLSVKGSGTMDLK